MKNGVIVDCFRRGVIGGIESAARLGFDGVQIYATGGEFSYNMTAADKKKYKKALSDSGVEVSALCGDMGGHGFEIAADNPGRVEISKRIADLAAEFGTSVVTTHIGVIPSDKSEPRYAAMLDALSEVGEYAKGVGVTFAIETGPEKAATLRGFLDNTHGGVGVNLDPANFVMVTRQDPVEAVELLGGYIVHTHVKDGKNLIAADPKLVYDCFAKGGIDALNVADYFTETPVGKGDVDFTAYFAALKAAGYDGYLTVEREAGENPDADIAAALAYISSVRKNLGI